MNKDGWLLPDQNPPGEGNYLTQLADGEQIVLKWNGQDWTDGEDLFSGIVVVYQPLPPNYQPPESKLIFCARCGNQIRIVSMTEFGVIGWRWECNQCEIKSKMHFGKLDCEISADRRVITWSPELYRWLSELNDKFLDKVPQTYPPSRSSTNFLIWLFLTEAGNK